MKNYIALGDSYTICEGMSVEDRWPNMLVNHEAYKEKLKLVANPSVTGWRTDQLIENELHLVDEKKATFATLLIGVNDWVQEVSAETYTANLKTILDFLEERQVQIVGLNIPDFSLTPKGGQYGKGRDITEGLKAFNLIFETACAKRNIPVVDIFSVSVRLGNKPEYAIEDGVHPSAIVYKEWFKEILKTFASISLD